MCGLAGIMQIHGGVREADFARICRTMTNRLTHRGPDGEGLWVDTDAGIALGHRRLSIIDLSPTGSQPMLSASGRWALTYNGEVYNFRELRAELEATGISFRGHSDTEVLLEACAKWGVEAASKRLIGMFAFALWDQKRRELWLVRDRLGIKPMYWASAASGQLIFGSELKALTAHPGCPSDIDRTAVAAFLERGFIPAPLTIHQGVHKLRPGHLIRISKEDGIGEARPYWDLRNVAAAGAADPFEGSDQDALDHLDELLRDAIKRRMVADVPLGTFLSGGIDSSLVAALMQHQTGERIRTFSIGFTASDYDEASHAKAVAAHLATDHMEFYVSPAEAQAVIPKLSEMYDEPFADSSQIPTYLVSALTRDHVTVALTGDGGDEVFAGYNRHVLAAQFEGLARSLPLPLRRAAAAGLGALSPQLWDAVLSRLPRRVRPPQAGEKMHKIAALFAAPPGGYYPVLTQLWPNAANLVIGLEDGPPEEQEGVPACLTDPSARIQFLDTLSYLPDDILTKVDRASMAVSLEARVPLLDHRVVEFAWRLPPRLKVRNGRGKWALRQILGKHVPPDLVNRPKMGFGVPIDQWLRGPLRDWAEGLLSGACFQRHALLNPVAVQEAWREHLSGRRNRHHELWAVLMLHAWCEGQLPESRTPRSASA